MDFSEKITQTNIRIRKQIMKECNDCIHWHSTGTEPYQGYCMTSAECVNAKNHPRFLDKNDEPIPEIKHWSTDKVRGHIAFTNTDSAGISRKRQSPVYPDVRTLTDESKKLLRKRRK